MIAQFATRIQVVREYDPGYDTSVTIRSAADVPTLVADLYDGIDREMVTSLALDTKHRVCARYVVSIGHLSGSPVHPRELFKTAIAANAAAVLLVHNHPTGDTTPSPDDWALTKRLKKAGEILGIELLDHVILGDGTDTYTSLRELGSW